MDVYGKSAAAGGNSDIASAVADMKAPIPVGGRETGADQFHFVDQSNGAIRDTCVQPGAVSLFCRGEEKQYCRPAEIARQ